MAPDTHSDAGAGHVSEVSQYWHRTGKVFRLSSLANFTGDTERKERSRTKAKGSKNSSQSYLLFVLLLIPIGNIKSQVIGTHREVSLQKN